MKNFEQGLVDPFKLIMQGPWGCPENFKQGPARKFHADSAEIFFIRVCSKNFKQGLADFKKFLRRRQKFYFFVQTDLVTFLQPGSAENFSIRVCSKKFDQSPVDRIAGFEQGREGA